MKHSLDLQHDNVGKIYFHYLLPAIASGLVASLYIIVDGIFIGRGIGSDGLAAVGIVVPMFTMFTGFSLIFGHGGSIRSTISAAEGREGLACRCCAPSVPTEFRPTVS